MVQESAEIRPNLQSTKEKSETVVGIWIVAITPDNKILVVENLKPKFESQKLPGQLNCPAETYKPSDRSFARTIERACREEIGHLNYDPKIAALGLIKLPIPETQVIAAPYLIRVAGENCFSFQPEDPGESRNPRWIHLDEVDDRTITVAGITVPLFRTPMREIAQMIKDHLNLGSLRVVHSQAPLIGKEVFESFKIQQSYPALSPREHLEAPAF